MIGARAPPAPHPPASEPPLALQPTIAPYTQSQGEGVPPTPHIQEKSTKKQTACTKNKCKHWGRKIIKLAKEITLN